MRLRKPASSSVALSPDYQARLARLFGLAGLEGNHSRLRTVHDNADALAWRLALIEQAEYSIDAQYYSWHLDTSGLVLIDRLIDAADRGVRVRLLLDDIHAFGIDRQIATLNSHHNIELRLFNPFTYRSRYKIIRLLELLFKLSRLNHRMHNKLLVVDNLLAIVGGRNIGDEYLGIPAALEFRDLDLLIAGNCIKTLSSSFDAYWNHRLSYTVHKLIALRPRKLDFRHLHKQIKIRLQPKTTALAHIEQHKEKLLAEESPRLLPITASVEVIYDAPSFSERATKFSVAALYEPLQKVREQIIIISAYFIPDEALLDAMQTLVQRGIRIQVFTNSLASIDVTVAFSGYQHYRQRLLAMGVELYEKRVADNVGCLPHKAYALHAKCIIYDNEQVYVGTLNLDPRSAYLNTEIGLLINSPELALEVSTNIGRQQERGDYWRLRQDDRLRWQSGDIWLDRQPSRGRWQNISNWLFALLPIKRHL